MLELIAVIADVVASFAVPIAVSMWAIRRTNWKWTLFASATACFVYALLSDFTIDYAIPDYDRSFSGVATDVVSNVVLGLAIGWTIIWRSKRARVSTTVAA
jgi:hypothetical protein